MPKLTARLERLERLLSSSRDADRQAECRSHYQDWRPHLFAAIRGHVPWQELIAWEQAHPEPVGDKSNHPAESESLRNELTSKLQQMRLCWAIPVQPASTQASTACHEP